MPSPTPPDPKESRFYQGNGSAPQLNAPPQRMAGPAPDAHRGLLSFLAPFLGAFAAVMVLGVGGVIAYFVMSGMHSPGSTADGKSEELIQNVAAWQPGQDTAKMLAADATPDISWWTKTFDLPKADEVSAYLQKQGLTVSRIEPAHYEETKDATTITYHVYAEVPAQLMHLDKTAWRPADPDMSRFAHVLALNDGLPAGKMWNTDQATVAAQAGTKLNFAWQVRWDKASNVVDTDRLPLSEGVFTQQEVSGYQTEAANTTSQLQAAIAQINAKVQADTQTQLAQVPENPPKPEMLSSKFGGDGSGEPTKSGERIGGGTVAGAAGGALFGAAAGDAGMGAGIGAGVGLLGGLIYDGVSKSNDRKKHERAVAAENQERMDDWRAQIKDLKQQRSKIQQDGLAARDRELTDLENRIAANHGHLDGPAATFAPEPEVAPAANAPAPADNAPSVVPAQPTADQPSGPIRQP